MSLKENQNKAKNEMEFNVLRSLYSNPSFTQRKLSSHLGVSLGSVNYCINALIDKGLVKVRRFKNLQLSKNIYTFSLQRVLLRSRVSHFRF